MLSRVIIKNFKSIGEPGVDLELKPLTILVGPNGAGKSSIVEAALLAWDGGQRNDGHVIAPWLNEKIQVEWLLHKRQQGVTTYISSAFDKLEDAAIPLCFTYALKVDDASHSWGLLPSEDGLLHEPPPSLSDKVWLALREKSYDRYKANKSKVFFVSGSRGKMKVEEWRSKDPSSPGIFGEELLPYLAKIFGSNEHNQEASAITNWAKEFGVSSLRAGIRTRNGSALTGADYVDAELNVSLQMALSSTGARQVITVIAQVFGAPRGSLIMIEEPEISLHPEAQTKLVEMFAKAIESDKQIIITTHSHYLLLALTDVIQSELLKPEDVAIWEVKKEKERGTVAQQLPISEDGVIKGWVSSFAKVDSKLLSNRTKQRARAKT